MDFLGLLGWCNREIRPKVCPIVLEGDLLREFVLVEFARGETFCLPQLGLSDRGAVFPDKFAKGLVRVDRLADVWPLCQALGDPQDGIFTDD